MSHPKDHPKHSAVKDSACADGVESDKKIPFPKAMAWSTPEKLQLLAHQFDNLYSFHVPHSLSDAVSEIAPWHKPARHLLLGDGNRALALDMAQAGAYYDQAVPTLKKIMKLTVPKELLLAVAQVENQYNGDPPKWMHLDKTPLPMNVNFHAWKDEFTAYNQAHPEAPITEASVRDNPKLNVMAAAIILNKIDARTDANVTGNARWAMIASQYGNTCSTRHVGRPIMYGAKVEQVMEHIVGQEQHPVHARQLGSISAPSTPMQKREPATPTLPPR